MRQEFGFLMEISLRFLGGYCSPPRAATSWTHTQRKTLKISRTLYVLGVMPAAKPTAQRSSIDPRIWTLRQTNHRRNHCRIQRPLRTYGPTDIRV